MENIINDTRHDNTSMYYYLGISLILDNISDEEKEKYKEFIIFENKLLKRIMQNERKIPDKIQEPQKINRSYSINSLGKDAIDVLLSQTQELKRLGFNSELERNEYFYKHYTVEQQKQLADVMNKQYLVFSDITIRRLNREFKKYSFDEVLYCWKNNWWVYLDEHNSIESVIRNLIMSKNSNEGILREEQNKMRELKCIYCILFLKKFTRN